MIEIIKTQLLALIADITLHPKPTYQIDGQTVKWNEYLKQLQDSADWCDKQSAKENGLINDIQFFDNTETIKLRHHSDESADVIQPALLRRFRHRSYEKVAETAVPVNYGHWYFDVPPEVEEPLPGDEIVQNDDTVWTITQVNATPLTHIR
jgi:hypothetical protein